MKASSSIASRFRLPATPILLTAVFLVAAAAGAGFLLYSYFQLTQTVEATLRPATELLPRLSALRAELYSLHADSEATLNSELPNYQTLTLRRESVADRLAEVQAVAPDTEAYSGTFQTLTDTLTVFDSVVNSFQNERPAPGRQVALLFEMRRAFQLSEGVLGQVYQTEEQSFYDAANSAFTSIRNLQTALFAVGAIVVGIGAVLVYNVRTASRREAILASGRLQVAAEVGAAAASVLSLEQLFDTTLSLITERFGYHYASIFLTDEKGEYAVLRAATGDAGRNLISGGHKVLIGSNSTIGQVAFSNRPLIYSENRRRAENFRTELITATRSELAVPLRQAGQIIGALDVQSLEADPFTDDDVAVLQTLGDQIAVAIGNAAQFTREQIRARQMSALSESAVQLTGPQTDTRNLLQAIVNRAAEIMVSDDAAIWLPVPGSDDLELRVNVNQPDQIGRRLKHNEGISGEVFASRKTMRIDDYRRWEGRSRATASSEIRSAMAVPLVWQGEITGTLTFSRSQVNRPFTNDDEQMSQLLAAQAAASIANARLLQETQNRVNELYTLNQIGQTIVAQTDLGGLFNAVRQDVNRTLDSHNFYIALYDPDTNIVELPYIYENGDITSVKPYQLGEGLTSLVIQSRQPLRLDNQAEAASRGALVTGQASQSYLGVPILLRDRCIGVLAVQDIDQPGKFSDTDARLLLTIASQIGLAIQNIRLLEQTRRRANELASINRITATASSFHDVQSMLEGISREITGIFDANSVSIALLDAVGERVTVVADFNRNPQDASLRGLALPLAENPAAAQVVQTAKPLVIADPQNSPLTESMHPQMRQHNAQSLMIVPLLVRGEALGLVSIDTDQEERAFGEGEVILAETLVTQVATSLDNSRLFEQTRRRADQLATAAEVARAAISTLDPDELIGRAAELIRERFDLYYVALFTISDDKQYALLRYATGEAGRTLLERRHRLEIGGQSMVGTAITSRKARIALDVGKEAVRFNNPLLPDTHSEMALPLVVGDTPLGALDVQSTAYNAFSEDDIIVLQTMADQIAVAIQNARLYLATERRVRLEQLINRVNAKLRRAVDADSIMNATLSELQDMLGARRVVAQLGPETMLRVTPPPRGTRPLRLPTPNLPSGGNGHESGNGHSGNGHNGNGSHTDETL